MLGRNSKQNGSFAWDRVCVASAGTDSRRDRSWCSW